MIESRCVSPIIITTFSLCVSAVRILKNILKLMGSAVIKITKSVFLKKGY